jgi:GT2 family glycosyltransferase
MLSDSEKNGLHPVEFYPARGLLIPAGVFAEIGLFDEKYLPHYFADYEFTKRASSRGIPVYANWDARIYTFPEESGDSRNRKRRNLKNYYNHLFNIKGEEISGIIPFTRCGTRPFGCCRWCWPKATFSAPWATG